ncbi:Fc receptor-like B [Sciurus carolinensis]|uniref:Fc receptor-like B n=1 Tax=Sciurus carolinensis TaxID=30640 RepID=A0AA41MF10_SCICA|nr:Fc receptor-like B [Sciurus carolinensis]
MDDDLNDPRETDFQIKGYTFSEPFHLIVSYDWLILQGPAAPIFEGDPLVLRCRAWQDWPLTQITFYRDGSALGPPGPNREFSIAVVQEADSGHYHCSAIFRSPGPGSPETASTLAITVQELFTAPVLRASPSAEPQEGSPMTLSCQTKLPLQRSATHLLFSFYKDGRTMRSRDLSSEFQVPTASVEHSGFYWCEAATEDGQVWKQSPQLEIRVQDWLILQVPYAAVFEGEPLVMRCRGWYDKVVYKLHYYHDDQAVRYFHSNTNYTVLQARASDSGRYQCSGTMRIPVESAPMFSAKVVVTVQELFQTPVLRVMSPKEIRGAAHRRVVLRCETRLHPQKRDTPLQFAFYKYSRAVRRFDWGAEYTVPEPEVEELEAYWCEAATATRSVRKRSPWLQLPGLGSSLGLASTNTPAPQAAALAPGNKPFSFRKPPVARSVPSVTSVPNATSVGLQFPAGRVPTSGPPACAPPTPLEQSAGALKPNVDLLLREMQLLKDLLSRVVLELKEPQVLPEFKGTRETPTSHFPLSQGSHQMTPVES